MRTGDATYTPSPATAPAAETAGTSFSFRPLTDPATGRLLPTTDLASDWLLGFVDRHRYWVFGLIGVSYLLGFNAQWRLEPDSALYLTIGRNLAEGLGYTFNGRPNRLAYPGLPTAFAGLFKVFGTGSLLPLIVAMFALGLATLGLVYRLFLLHAGRPTAVMITYGVAITRVFYRYTFELLTDLPFLFGVMLFLVGYEAVFHRRDGSTGTAGAERGANGAAPAVPRGRARWFDYVFLVAGLVVAVSTRPAMWALVVAAAAALGWSLVRSVFQRRIPWKPLLALAVIAAAIAGFYLQDPRRSPATPAAPAGGGYVEEDQLFDPDLDRLAAMAGRARDNFVPVFGRVIARAVYGSPLGVPLSLVLDLTVVALGVALVRVRPVWGLWVAATVAVVLLVPKPHERYFLPILPLLVFAWWTALRWVNRRLPGGWGNGAFFLLLVVGAAPNLFQVGKFVYEQRQRPFLQAYKGGRYASIYDAARMVKRYTPPSTPVAGVAGGAGESSAAQPPTWVLVGPKNARIVSFLTGRYAAEPDAATQFDPAKGDAWVHGYVLDPSDPGPADQNDGRPTVRQWLAARGFEVSPDVIATVPNKDPDAAAPWTLHRIRPKR